jgi:hypothetical protein
MGCLSVYTKHAIKLHWAGVRELLEREKTLHLKELMAIPGAQRLINDNPRLTPLAYLHFSETLNETRHH